MTPYTTAAFASDGVSYLCYAGGRPSQTIYACLSIGTGTGGTTPTNRTLASGADRLPITIKNGAADVGNGTSYPMHGPRQIPVAASGALATGSFAVTMSIPKTASIPPPGTYASDFASLDATMYYTFGSAPATCSQLLAGSYQSDGSSSHVSARVLPTCTVATTGMAFPTASIFTSPVDATATVSVTCNASTPVTVALVNGPTGTGPTNRQM